MNEIIQKTLLENNGFMTAQQAKLKGVSGKMLKNCIESGELERVSHGLYMDSNCMADEYYIAQYRCPKAVFSYDTALYFHGLSDRTPIVLTMTIPSGQYTKLLYEKEYYEFFYCKKELFDLGLITMSSPYGNNIRVYNKERTVCDCIKKKSKMDSDIVLSAIKQYVSEKGNDYALLLEYAEIFKIKDKVRQYLEVLS